MKAVINKLPYESLLISHRFLKKRGFEPSQAQIENGKQGLIIVSLSLDFNFQNHKNLKIRLNRLNIKNEQHSSAPSHDPYARPYTFFAIKSDT